MVEAQRRLMEMELHKAKVVVKRSHVIQRTQRIFLRKKIGLLKQGLFLCF
jgi:hypothetical protein